MGHWNVWYPRPRRHPTENERRAWGSLLLRTLLGRTQPIEEEGEQKRTKRKKKRRRGSSTN